MHPSRRLTILARLGFAARGFVYLLVGWIAFDAARKGGQPVDNQAALGSLVDEPFGRALLVVIAAGLAGYALWRLLEAALDPEQRSKTTKGMFERLGYALSGVTHALLAIYAGRLALAGRAGEGSAPGDARARDWSAWLMEQPGGALLLILVAVGLFVIAAAQAGKSYKASFMQDLEGGTPVPQYVRTAGRIGYAARALVFALVGLFFARAGLHANPAEAGGMGQALRELQSQGHGQILLGILALGLLLFGLFSFVEARYRRLRVITPVG